MKKKTALLLILMVVALVLSACSGGSPLTGRWIIQNDETVAWIAEKMVFNQDGSGIMDIIPFRWSTEGDIIRLTTSFTSETYRYSLAGDTLTFYDTNGTRIMTCKRQ